MGTNGFLSLNMQHLTEISQHLYDRYKEPIVGYAIIILCTCECSIHAHSKFCRIYFGRRPTIYVKDPEMIKQITITEFECFVDRPVSA